MSERDWDGELYDKISAPQQTWGKEVLERLTLRGDETVLDAGCGSGRVTEMVLARLPEGRVIGVDASDSMVEVARRRLGDRVEIRLCDLLELEVQPAVDAIVSTATFHWIGDHDALFARMRAALREGGRLVAQCGGQGNVARVHAAASSVGESEPFAARLAGWSGPWNFAGPEVTEQRLLAAGFAQARCWLTPAPVVPPQPPEFLRSVILRPYMQRLAEEQREPFAKAVEAQLGEPLEIDYVRLNIDALG